MKNKNGFTLIELMATLIVLSVVALITYPQILIIINNFKISAFKKSAEGLIRAVQNDSTNVEFGGGTYRLFNDILRINNRVVELDGDTYGTGTIIINDDGDVKLGLDYENTCATKDFQDTIITFTTGVCDIPVIPSLIDYTWFEDLTLDTTINNATLSSYEYQPTVYGINNTLTLDTNPWGVTDIMWRGANDPASTTDGGFYYGANNNYHIPVDPKKTYRFSVWVKNVGTTGNMQLFNSTLYSSQTSAAETFTYTNGTSPVTQSSISTSTYNEWLLLVGYLHHYGSVDSASVGSIYRTNGTVIGTAIPRRMNSTTNYILYRGPRFNTTDGYGYYYRPRLDVVDGNEPTIADLLAGQENGNLYDN